MRPMFLVCEGTLGLAAYPCVDVCKAAEANQHDRGSFLCSTSLQCPMRCLHAREDECGDSDEAWSFISHSRTMQPAPSAAPCFTMVSHLVCPGMFGTTSVSQQNTSILKQGLGFRVGVQRESQPALYLDQTRVQTIRHLLDAACQPLSD